MLVAGEVSTAQLRVQRPVAIAPGDPESLLQEPLAAAEAYLGGIERRMETRA